MSHSRSASVHQHKIWTAGLYYPITVAMLTFLIGSYALVETHHERIWKEVEN